MVKIESMTDKVGTAANGPSTAISTGIMTMAAPKPENPRTRPPKTAAPKSKAAGSGRRSISANQSATTGIISVAIFHEKAADRPAF
jgi:hypothetical protein